MDAFEIRSLLERRGFAEYWHEGTYDREKVKCLGFVNQKYGVIYLKSDPNRRDVPANSAPLVIHGDYGQRLNSLKETGANVSWVNSAQLYFNSNLRGYSSKLNPKHRGKTPKPEKFGITFEVNNKTELDDLLGWMCGSNGFGEFDFVNDVDSRPFKNLGHIEDDVIKVAIKTRRGQPAFRQALLTEYKVTCCITGCKIEAVLEAAHIIPHGDETNYSVYNGLLLRADVHTLFDLGLLRISEAGIVMVDSSLKNSEYFQYDGDRIINGQLPRKMSESLSARNQHFNVVAN
jgi:hypothetical protein